MAANTDAGRAPPRSAFRVWGKVLGAPRQLRRYLHGVDEVVAQVVTEVLWRSALLGEGLDDGALEQLENRVVPLGHLDARCKHRWQRAAAKSGGRRHRGQKRQVAEAGVEGCGRNTVAGEGEAARPMKSSTEISA